MYSRLLRHVLLPVAFRLRGRRYLRLVKQLRRHQYRPRAVASAESLQKLQELLRLAFAEVPHYRERFGDRGLSPDVRSLEELERFPVLTKEDLLANFPDRLAAPGFGTGEVELVGTRGTTDRVMVLHDRERCEVEWACRYVAHSEDSDYAMGKPVVLVPPDECSKLCGIEEVRESRLGRQVERMIRERSFGELAARAELRRLVMEAWVSRTTLLPPFGAGGTHIAERHLARYVEHIRDVRPVLLKALPEYLVGIARHASRTGTGLPRVPVVKPMGSKLSPSVVSELELVFRGRVREDYGSQEMGAMAFDCRHRQGLHVFEDCFLIEVTRAGERVPDGELGVVLVTDLCNRAMPLVRYRIGDVGRIRSEPCSCGRTSRRLFIEGRLEDSIVLHDGKVITAERLGNLLYSFPGLDDFQLVEQREGHFTLDYVARREASLDMDALRRLLSSMLGVETPVRLAARETILPEPSGKFRHVKSRSFPRLDAHNPVEPAVVHR